MNDNNIPIIGEQPRKPIPGSKQNKELPKADRALQGLDTMAKKMDDILKSMNGRLRHLENLTAYLMAEKADSVDKMTEFELVNNVDHMSYASGMVWFHGKERKFYEIQALLSFFKVEEIGVATDDSNNKLYKCVNEENSMEIEFAAETEDDAWKMLDEWCQTTMSEKEKFENSKDS